MQWWDGALGILIGLGCVYVILLAGLWVYARRNPEVVSMKDALRLLPDLLRLIRRMAADRTVASGVRIRLLLLMAYLVMPVDLVPDFLPVIGYADDVIIVAWVLRSVIRSAGPEAFRRHWPGTPAGLHVIERLAGLNPREADQEKP
ncbi:YkvA family protein [Arthrobacter sp. D1-17]